MAQPSPRNPLDCYLRRQIDDRTNHCKRLVSARIDYSENLFRKDLQSHYGCVNAIEFSPQGDLLVSGGDDKRVLLWKVEQAIQGVGKPMAMRAQHGSNIFCLGYDSGRTKIFSAGNDNQVIVHNLQTGDPLHYFLHEKPVYGLSIHPHNDNVFASACDDGRILIFDTRDSSSPEAAAFCLAQYETAFHSVMFNPMEPRNLATANAQEGISLWDVRKPLTPALKYGSQGPSQGCMNVRFNSSGTRLLALRRRLPPVLYATDSTTHLCHFDQPGYYNSCTMKSCCFAGDDDEYILSGSDNFNLYMWKIPSDEVKWVDSAHMILRGHRSIVNQVRYNRASCILASSGVEKIIKIWSPFPLCSPCLGGLKRDSGKQERQRRVFTHDEYVRLILRSGQFMTHDYSHQSTREDPRMMAFFDSLVQREIEEWGSSSRRNISELKNSPTTGQTQTATDSDDSPEPRYDFVHSVLRVTGRYSSRTRSSNSGEGEAAGTAESAGSSSNGVSGGVTPERSVDSPNRITRLIGNRRRKLMRLAAMEAGTHVASNPSRKRAGNREDSEEPDFSGAEDDENDLEDEAEDENNEEDEEEILPPLNAKVKPEYRAKRSKSLRSLKRKQGAVSGRRVRARRKCVVYNLNISSDTETDGDSPGTQKRNKNRAGESSDSGSDIFLDATQPSTSSGLRSRRSRYAINAIVVDEEDEEEEEEDRNSAIRRKRARKDVQISATSSSSSSTSSSASSSSSSSSSCASKSCRRRQCKTKKKKTDRRRRGSSSRRDDGERRKIASNEVSKNSGASERFFAGDSKAKISTKRLSNVKTASTTEELLPPPVSLPLAATSDSGITSGISTVEKCDGEKNTNGAESSDHETRRKSLVTFKKLRDSARRGYRKRLSNHSKISNGTDSSD